MTSLTASVGLFLQLARAQAAPDAAFFQGLGEIHLRLKADIHDSLAARGSGRLTKDDAVRMVLAHLADSGVPEAYVRAAFDDPETRVIPEIPGYFPDREPARGQDDDHYDSFVAADRVQAGVDFYRTHQGLLESVQARYGVDPFTLAGLIGVETYYGTVTGDFPVFSALYTITLKVPARTEWAARELAEWLRLCHLGQVAPHGVKGSYAGAFGYYQFMPSSYNRLAVDFDGDGRRRWDEWPDVLGSVAHYLEDAGWQAGGDLAKGSKNYAAIYAYNHSHRYVRAVVGLRAEILKKVSSSVRGRGPAAAARAP